MKNKLVNILNEMPKNKGLVLIEDIADHLIKNNVIVLPCKIGSTVWVVSKNATEPYPAKFKLDDLDRFGKRVFRTREEAMKKMRCKI